MKSPKSKLDVECLVLHQNWEECSPFPHSSLILHGLKKKKKRKRLEDCKFIHQLLSPITNFWTIYSQMSPGIESQNKHQIVFSLSVELCLLPWSLQHFAFWNSQRDFFKCQRPCCVTGRTTLGWPVESTTILNFAFFFELKKICSKSFRFYLNKKWA